MSKILYIVFLFLITLTSKAQDTIIFDDARVHPVKIVSVSKTAVTYERRGKTKEAKFSDVMQFKHGEKWFYYNEDEKKLEKQSESFFEYVANPLQYPKNFGYSRFAIGATVAFNLTKPTNGTPRYYAPADNFRIRIEPEVYFTDWFSLKIPVIIPLTSGDASADGLIVNYDYVPKEYPETVIQGVDFRYETETYDYYVIGSNNLDYPQKFFYNYSDKNKSGAGTRDILGQIGLTPKFYPFLQQKIAFYIAPSFNIGIGNYNQVNYYATFDYSDSLAFGSPSYTFYDESWELISERLEVQKANFTYFRGELTVGLNFNLTKSLNFTIESGITSDLIPLSPIQNSNLTVIRQEDGFEYETQSFEPTVLHYRSNGLQGGFVTNRFLLVYRFGGKKLEE